MKIISHMLINEMASSETSTLEEQAFQRKQKLKNLKRKYEAEEISNKPTTTSVLPKPKFRSYKPQDKELSQHALPDTSPSNVKNDVKDLLDLAKSEIVIDELDIATLTPKQPDWDLKRDIAKKLSILEKRTQKAIAELIWEKLKEKRDLADIAN